jgi:BirA family transcriptional regulator, biotin operon repressor / biotin---[acetyl-CoA-carboxylase] ligase
MSHTLPPELFRAIERARPRLGRLGSSVLFLESTGSTNDVALRLAASGDHEGAVVVADEQTVGRGRRGHNWFSPAQSGLYVSVVVSPARARTEPARAIALLTLATGVALAEGIEAFSGLRASLKWPNDLFMARRKFAGILAEASGSRPVGEAVVLGYGINVRSTAYPPELGDRATSLEAELGRHVDRDQMLVETLVALARRYQDLLDGRFGAILDAWRDRAPSAIGARVAWQTATGEESGITAGIDDDGALLVQVGGRTERVIAGELKWL